MSKRIKNKSFLKNNWLLIVALIYLLLPVDFIPDTVPVFGTFDDSVLVIINLIEEFIRLKEHAQKNEIKGDVKEGEIVK